ncbi:hypothetical protein EC988_010102, partial [Linderina pennispora]
HYAVPTPAHASTVNSYLAHVHPSLVDNKSGGTILSSWLCRDFVQATVSVLRSPQLLDVQDLALAMFADVLHFSSFAKHMPVNWKLHSKDVPDRAFRSTMVYSMVPAITESGVLGEDLEKALEMIVGETDAKRRKALLRLALLPMLAVEKSQMFSKKAEKKKQTAAQNVPEEWTTRSTLSLFDNDDEFSLGSIMP